MLTSTTAMALPRRPRSLIVIGGRAIALELGQTFARFGSEVTLLQRSPRLIPEHEPEIGEALADYLRAEGLAVHTGVTPLAIRQEAGDKVITAEVDGARRGFRAEQVLMAVGRTPRTADMGLAEAGVTLDRDGFIVVSLLIPSAAFAQGTTLAGGNPDFDVTAAEEEGYWYSRYSYSMSNLTMISGMSDVFMPDMAMIRQMIQMADVDPNDGDTAMPPMNAALLSTIYASGDPHFVQPIDMTMMDFGTMRWDPASFDTTVTAPAMGWTIIKEIEWAKQFHVDDHFGTPTDNFGAQWRFVGLVIMAEAKMQAQHALQMLKNAQDLIADSDGAVDWAGQ